MGIRDIKNKFGSVTKKFNKILDKGSELENKFKDKISDINDIKEDPSGKIVEKLRGKLGIDDIFFGEALGANLSNNPAFRKQHNQYTQKAESFASFVKPGIPHLVFEVDTVNSVTTKASENAATIAKGINKLTNWNINVNELSNTNLNVQKQFKIPIDPSFLNTSYTFNFSQYDSISSAEKAEDLFDITSDALTNQLKGLMSSSRGAQAASLKTGVAINPNMENAFTGVDFRKLNFNFELIPKNENQALEMQKIVHLLKYWSHPEAIQSVNGKLLKFPFYWKIYYNDGQGGTTGVSFKTKVCYCESIQIEYGSNNGYILMKDNSPACVKISLSFTENAYITRQDIGASGTNGGNY